MNASSILRLHGKSVQRLYGRMPRFAAVGALGTVLNIGIMTVLIAWGVNYLVAAILATEATIVSNFLMQERWVFAGPGPHGRSLTMRFLHSFGFNNAETLVRMPFLWLLVYKAGMFSPLAQFGTLCVAVILRYVFYSRVIYAPAPVGPAHGVAFGPLTEDGVDDRVI